MHAIKRTAGASATMLGAALISFVARASFSEKAISTIHPARPIVMHRLIAVLKMRLVSRGRERARLSEIIFDIAIGIPAVAMVSNIE